MVWHTYLNKEFFIIVHMSYTTTRVRDSCGSREYCSRGEMYNILRNMRRQDLLANHSHETLSTFENF